MKSFHRINMWNPEVWVERPIGLLLDGGDGNDVLCLASNWISGIGCRLFGVYLWSMRMYGVTNVLHINTVFTIYNVNDYRFPLCVHI